MKLLNVSSTTSLPVLNPREGNIRMPTRNIHNHSNDEIYLRPIAVIKPSVASSVPGSDTYEKGTLLDIYA